MKKIIFLTAIIFSFVLCGWGQGTTYVISGIVIDNQLNTPLFYATVGVLNVGDSTVVVGGTADEHGKFRLTNVKSGSYIFQTSYIGYEIERFPLSVSGERKEISVDTIRLKSSATTLKGVTIADKKPVYMSDGEKTLYNVSEDLSVQTGTAVDALQNAPGVEVDIEGNITLRGLPSVEIWINDQPSRLNAENLKTYLQQLPANSLERIEVIANPSARYSAAGTGGIINIIIKTNIKKDTFLSFGINGSTRPMVSPWISYMFANEKFSINIYTYGYYYMYKNKSDGYEIQLNENGDTSNFRKYTTQSKSNSISAGIYTSGSYTFDTMNMISFWTGFNITPFNKNYYFSEYQYEEYIFSPGIYDYTAKSNTNYENMRGYLGTWYQHKFNSKGHKISAFIGGNYSEYNHNNLYNRLYQHYSGRNTDIKNSRSDNHNYIYGGLDYTLPYSEKGEIVIGMSSNFWNKFDYQASDTLILPNIYQLDSMRLYNNKEKNSSIDGYLTVQQKFGKFTVKGGIRVQSRFLNYEVINKPENQGNKNYLGFFPSIHLSYASKSMHNVKMSYIRRVNYPENNQLTTFIWYDEDDYSTGNKNLQPTFTNAIEAGWTKYFTKFGSVGLSTYFRNNKNEIGDLTDVAYNEYFGRYVSFSMPVNSGKSHCYGGDANVMYKLKTFMNINLNAGVYQAHTETVFRNNTLVITDDFVYNFRLNFWAKLWKFLEVNASGNYRSKSKFLFYETHPIYSINCGLRSDFLNRKISVFLNVQNIFNWGRQRNNNTNPYYIAYSSTKPNSRFISTGITFRFGKIELEQQARTGGNTE